MAEDCCSKTLPADALAADQRRVLVWVLLINIATFMMMVGGSLLSGSSSARCSCWRSFRDRRHGCWAGRGGN